MHKLVRTLAALSGLALLVLGGVGVWTGYEAWVNSAWVVTTCEVVDAGVRIVEGGAELSATLRLEGSSGDGVEVVRRLPRDAGLAAHATFRPGYIVQCAHPLADRSALSLEEGRFITLRPLAIAGSVTAGLMLLTLLATLGLRRSD